VLVMGFLIVAGGLQVSAQLTVKGKVSEAPSGDSMPGVNVVVKGTSTGVSTDLDGGYTITVPNENAVLQFSYIGYTTQEIVVGSQRTIDVQLREDTQLLDEVVVIGYGTQKRGSITGSIAAINAEVIQDVAVTNLSNALAGRLSGVSINQTTSRPGASATFNIRAQGTINNSAPLYVINGVVSTKEAFDALDASEVENISVLKDGASAAIYGSRAANGVVLVATKKGNTSKPVITYSGMYGFSDAVGVPTVMTAYEHAVYMNNNRYLGWLTNPNRDPNADPRVNNRDWFTDDELAHFKTTNYWALDDEWRTPITTRHTLNVNGGNDAVRYFIGGSYLYNKGSFDNLKYSRYTLRASVDAKITRTLSASLDISTNARYDERPYWGSDGGESNDSSSAVSGSTIGNLGSQEMHDLYKGLLLRNRMVPAYINGLPVSHRQLAIEQHAGMNISKESGEQLQRWQMVTTNAELRYDAPFLKGLQASLQLSNTSNNRLVKQVDYPYTMYYFTASGTNGHYIDLDANPQIVGTQLRAGNPPSRVKKIHQQTRSYQLNAFIRYNNTFGKHAVNGVLVYEQYERFFEMFDAQRNGLISWELPELFATSGDVSDSTVGAGSVTEDGRISYIGRMEYQYDNKYLLEAVLRIDGSVRFAPAERWGYFPSVSAGWIMSSEDFFKNNIKFINFFKLRGSVSMLGNDAVGGWQWMPRYTINNTVAVFEDATYALLPGSLPNPKLTWEKSTSYNIGFDARMLKNRLGFGFEYFTRRTTDILDNRIASVPTTFGASLPSENYATIGAKGIEIEPNWRDKIGRNFTYSLTGNFGWAKSWWIKRDEALNIREYRSEIGQPLNRVWGYQYTDIIRSEAEAQALRDAKVTILGQEARAGMLMYKDIRSATDDHTPDGIITTDDQVVIIQNARPRFTYGFGADAKWKSVSANIHFSGLGGHQKLNDYRQTSVNNYTNQFAWKNDHWTPENPDASQPSPVGNQNSQSSTFWVEDASFLRCDLATVSYDLPNGWTNAVGLSKVRLYVQGTNLFLFKNKIYWMDPQATRSTDYPRLREFTMGINITL